MKESLDVREFNLYNIEVNAFISWYENKQAGSGTASYAIDKHNNNKGPFSARKDYVIFDKILTFEVNEYKTK
ncbi:galactose oxidase [Paenibacillus alvei]|uniref:Galactose oxidase n=1 Tax=Paenibacillus alvei TaxID=44250 RepID=A0AAP6ZVV2_PAEAL|nr:galactose oxidase [Paenibacillus alvei]